MKAQWNGANVADYVLPVGDGFATARALFREFDRLNSPTLAYPRLTGTDVAGREIWRVDISNRRGEIYDHLTVLIRRDATLEAEG